MATTPATATVSPPPPVASTANPVVGEIETFLADLISQLQLGPPNQRGRPPVLPALLLWAGLLVCVLRGFSSQLALWRLICLHGLWRFPRVAISDQAVYDRLERGGLAPLEHLFDRLTALLRDRLSPFLATQPPLAPFATEVVALDETTLDQVARRLPSLRGAPPGDPRLLPGKLAGVFDLRRQLWRTLVLIPNAQQNEKVAARTLLAGLPRGSLVLADLGYFAFAWFDALTEQGFWWLSRLRAKTSYQVVHTFYHDPISQTRDALVWLGAYRADRARHLVRLVEFQVGATTFQYLTNVTDPARLSITMIAQVYARRWDIELAIKLIKRELGLHLLWSAKSVVIWQQVYAVIMIAQVLQAMRVEIASRAGVELFEVSLPLLVEYLPLIAAQGEDPIQTFVERGREVGFIRPSRRTQIRTPTIDAAAYVWPADDLVRERPARYAQRRCGPRAAS